MGVQVEKEAVRGTEDEEDERDEDEGQYENRGAESGTFQFSRRCQMRAVVAEMSKQSFHSDKCTLPPAARVVLVQGRCKSREEHEREDLVAQSTDRRQLRRTR